MATIWDGATVLLTGGTGSFGQAFARYLLTQHRPAAVRIYSRDELKQAEMDRRFADDRLRFFIGDVRDLPRLRRACQGADIIVHAAALKHVPACEYNPLEAIKTNVLGAANVIDAALDTGVRRVMAISTDKAANPVNLYGATKLCAEKLIVQSNSYVGGGPTRLSCCRYGNVLGSRGSVVPLFREQQSNGVLRITDRRMTRFWMTLEQAAAFVAWAVEAMHGGEIFVPKLPSVRLVDLARAVAPNCRLEEVGVRPGEKLHEVLITAEEAWRTRVAECCYIIEPQHPWWPAEAWAHLPCLPEGFVYRSDTNDVWLDEAALAALVAELDAP